MDHKLFCIVGPSCSGKDTLLPTILEHFKGIILPLVTHTTRPIREGEVDGETYFFRDAIDPSENILEMRRYDTVEGPWYYATIADEHFDLTKSNYVMINTPDGIKALAKNMPQKSMVIIYVDTSLETRLKRALTRDIEKDGNSRESLRRLIADIKDFEPNNLKLNEYDAVADYCVVPNNCELDVFKKQVLTIITFILKKQNDGGSYESK